MRYVGHPHDVKVHMFEHEDPDVVYRVMVKSSSAERSSATWHNFVEGYRADGFLLEGKAVGSGKVWIGVLTKPELGGFN